MAINLELNLGEDKEVYDNLLAELPEGAEVQQTGIVVPRHTTLTPLSFKVTGLVANTPYLVTVSCEGETAPQPVVGFVPSSDEHSLSIVLGYGVSTMTIFGPRGSEEAKFLVSTTHYASLFRTHARIITENLVLPLRRAQERIESSVAYYLALPLIADVSYLIPSDLEILGTLSNKLLVKNLLHRPGTEGATFELLSAFAASSPVYNPMKNLGAPEFPIFRGAEDYSGWEAHVWLPNREVERWSAFITLINNLPQLYTLLEVSEGRVFLRDGDKVREHRFDFDSEFANTVLEGVTRDECFENLFRLDMSIEAEIYLGFCQAAYSFDTQISGLATPDTDPLAVTNWSNFTLSGRFEQQYGISYDVHHWVYDAPVLGVIDGVNRFYSLSETPTTRQAVKLFLDGLLLRLNVDYRISTNDDFRSGAFFMSSSLDTLYIEIDVGDPRPFLAPFFASFEITGAADVQYLVTAGEQTLTSVAFVVSHAPASSGDPQDARLHYVTPTLAEGSYAGANQYGTESLVLGATSHTLTFPTPSAAIDYQLFVQIGEDPLPGGGPSSVSQLFHVVRNKTLSSAVIEFSDAVDTSNGLLHWWLIEGDNVAVERGTVTLTNGLTSATVPFLGGPYLDPKVVMLQIWNTTAVGDVLPQFVSFKDLTGLAFTAQFADAIVGSDYRMDWAIFPSEAGNVIEMFFPPTVNTVLEAHYDTEWAYWIHSGPLEGVDGVRTIFTLPTECPYPESMYLVCDGRLLTQGNNNQYVVETPTTIRTTFVPSSPQWLWAVYPVANPGNDELPDSKWDQGFLARQLDAVGQIATGAIMNIDKIDAGDTVTLRGTTFTAQAPARGIISNPLRIVPSDSLTFVELGKTFTGVLYATYFAPQLKATLTPSSFDAGTDVVSLGVAHGLISNTGVYFQTEGTLPAPLVANVRYFIVSVTSTTFKLALTASGPAIDLTTTGSGSISLMIGALPTEFKAGRTRDDDAVELVASINANLGDIYFANYLGSGITTVTAKSLTGTSSNQTLTVLGSSMTVSNIGGDSLPDVPEIQTISFVPTPTSGKFNLVFNGYSTVDLPYTTTATQLAAALNSLPDPTDATVTGTVSTGFAVTFDAIDGKTDQPMLEVKGPSLIFATTDVNVAANTITLAAHGLVERQSIGFFTSGTLPAPLLMGTTYFVHVIDANTIKVLAVADALAFIDLTTQGLGAHTLSSVNLNDGTFPTTITITETQKGYGNRFPAGVQRAFDTDALASVLANHPRLLPLYNVSSEEGETTLTAVASGEYSNAAITLMGTSLTALDLRGGSAARIDLPMLSKKGFYNYVAPVLALDGLSTVRYESFGGNAVQFDTDPVALQQPYYVSQVFPVDDHPLDSMHANQPCPYPKGLFTQGLFAQLTETEIIVEQSGLLVVTVSNLPLQEEPIGDVDGVNMVFDITLKSCAGENSLMLWVDGLFQPPNLYSYSEIAGHGRLTLTFAPVSPQTLWVWYLPEGDGCAEEHVEVPTGAVDSVNQNYLIPSGPLVERSNIVVFLEGLFQLLDDDYVVDPGNSSITFLGALAPATGQTLWSHLNEGNISTEQWRQVVVGTGDGVTTVFTIPILITAELPISQDSVILAMDGLVQREGVDFVVNLGVDAAPNGTITFSGGAPEAGRVIEVAYIRR